MKQNRLLTEKDVDYLEERFKEIFITQEHFKDYRSELFNKLDAILKEVLASREEQTILSHHQSAHSDQLENHEKRITTLESS